MRRLLIIIASLLLATNAFAARNGSGTYTIPNTATEGAVISSSDWNENFNDVGDEITNSLPRDGQAGMTGQFQATSGSAGIPSISFTSDTDTGFYRSGANEVTFAANGIAQFTIGSAGSSLAPPGICVPYGGATEPSGWIFAYGQAISRTTYANLFTAFSTTYGTGDGSTTFNMPDLRGRVVAGQDDMGGSSANRLTDVAQPDGGSLNGDTLGDTGGAETHTQLSAEIAAHTHGAGSYAVGTSITNGSSVIRGSFTGNNNGGGSSINTITSPSVDTLSLASGTVSGTSSSTGSGTAFNIVQPTIVLNYICKY